MGFFDWTFKQRYDTEKELLLALLSHTEAWFNELTLPLRELLFEMLYGDIERLEPAKYVEIARELYFQKIQSNHGSYVRNTMEQMSEHGIPLFTSRYKLQQRTQEFLVSGRFLKDIVEYFSRWKYLDRATQYEYRSQIRDAWENLRACRERLVTEINRQIRRLG
jgi:hypothetical protein